MKNSKNILALKNFHYIVPTPQGKVTNSKYVIALNAEMMNLGFKLDTKLQKELSKCSQKQIKEIRQELIHELSEMIGADKSYYTLFKNFPEDVPEPDEYLFSRMVGFIENILMPQEGDDNKEQLSCGCYISKDLFDISLFGACPICQRQNNLTGKSVFTNNRNWDYCPRELKKITLIKDEQFKVMVKNVIQLPVAFSYEQKKFISELSKEYSDLIINSLPEKFINKENQATIISALIKMKASIPSFELKTSTDVLRIAVALSNGDVSLKDKTNFKLSSYERKAVLKYLENIVEPLEDMIKYKQRWLRFGEYVHIGAEGRKYPRTYKHFDTLRNNPKSIKTQSTLIHNTVFNKKLRNESRAFGLLTKRPGIFARNLDFLLRNFNEENVVNNFESVINKVPTIMLLKMSQFFKHRTEKSSFRFFIPKGNTSSLYYTDKDNRDVLNSKTVENVLKIISVELEARYSNKPQVFYVDKDSMEKTIVPTVLRNTTKSVKSLTRGSRVKFDKTTNTLRLFVYWKENENSGRIDVDLSAIAYDTNWKYINHLSWTSGKALNCVHSGDVQSAPEGASEFIDLDLKYLKENNVRYVAMNLFSFTGQMFDTYEIFAGIMERTKNSSNELYNPTEVKNKFDLSGSTSAQMPLFLDLATGELIWVDMAMGKQARGTVEKSSIRIKQIANSMKNMDKFTPTVMDLINLHAKASNSKIDFKKDPTVKYDFEFTLDNIKNIEEFLTRWVVTKEG